MMLHEIRALFFDEDGSDFEVVVVTRGVLLLTSLD
jgi:hypothetical protein